MAAPARLRMSRTALLPVALLFLTMLPVAAVRPWTPVLLLVPVVVAAWVVRVGVDVDEDGITVRRCWGSAWCAGRSWPGSASPSAASCGW